MYEASQTEACSAKTNLSVLCLDIWSWVFLRIDPFTKNLVHQVRHMRESHDSLNSGDSRIDITESLKRSGSESD